MHFLLDVVHFITNLFILNLAGERLDNLPWYTILLAIVRVRFFTNVLGVREPVQSHRMRPTVAIQDVEERLVNDR